MSTQAPQSLQFLVDNHGVRTAVVLPIAMYNELIALKQELCQLKPATQESYQFVVKGISACGYPKGDPRKPQFVIQSGSHAQLEAAPSLRAAVRELREQLIADGHLRVVGTVLEFSKDVEFSSPSMAACVVAGNARSGLDAWLNPRGRSLKQCGYG